MFDLTKEVILDENSQKLYKRLRAILYALTVASAIGLTYITIFPSAYFTFSFLNPNSTKNTVIDPRISDGSSAEKGKFSSELPTLFDTALVGNYSKAKISLTLDKKSAAPEDGKISVRKSYQAFLYPDGDPIGFRDGTLLKNNGNYFMVSNGKIRRFINLSILQALGFSENSFLEVQDADFTYNPIGDPLNNKSGYPDDSLFKIDDQYYILTDQKLEKFVSPSGYLSNYSSSQAISKDQGFLASYPMLEESAGFSDGSIISYGGSVFIVSRGLVLPINNTITFESMGYDWNDLISASGDEFSLYEKAKLFTLDSPHPDGTIFVTAEDSKWYMIEDGQKHLLPTSLIAKSWTEKSPIRVSVNSMDISESCDFQKGPLSSRTYSCEIPTDKFKELIGKDYEFQISTKSEVKAENLDVTFKKTANWQNLKSAARNFINKVKGNYVPQS